MTAALDLTTTVMVPARVWGIGQAGRGVIFNCQPKLEKHKPILQEGDVQVSNIGLPSKDDIHTFVLVGFDASLI